MSREWQPGDVVGGLLDGNEIVGIVRGGGKRVFYADSVTTDQVDLSCVQDVHPLVVIDPEDREQAERLRDFYLDEGVPRLRWQVDHMQAALRSLVTPPKPDEPTGFGAVVEDEAGFQWVRSHTHIQAAPWTHPTVSGTYPYADIAAVKVLSEGVTP